MFFPFLISFRETLEAALIVGVLFGILHRFGFKNECAIIKKASLAALIVTFIALIAVTAVGKSLSGLFTEDIEKVFEGSMMILSTGFITWAIFWFHKHLQMRRGKHILKIHEKIKHGNFQGFFWMVFLLVVREGIEIVLFISTLSFSTSQSVLIFGAFLGSATAILAGTVLYSASIKIHYQKLFQVTSVLLAVFSAGLLVRGIGELTEAHLVPEITAFSMHVPLFPSGQSWIAEALHMFLGLDKTLTMPQYLSYALYFSCVFFGLRKLNTPSGKAYARKN